MKASATSWKHEPFGECVSLRYEALFDAEQFARITDGIVPQEMEDKWFVYYEEPFLFLHRSWTGQTVYRLKFQPLNNHVRVAEALWSKDLADRAAADSGAEYQVRLLDFLVQNLLLGQCKAFPLPSESDAHPPGALQAHGAGTRYGEYAGVTTEQSIEMKKSLWTMLFGPRS